MSMLQLADIVGFRNRRYYVGKIDTYDERIDMSYRDTPDRTMLRVTALFGHEGMLRMAREAGEDNLEKQDR